MVSHGALLSKGTLEIHCREICSWYGSLDSLGIPTACKDSVRVIKRFLVLDQFLDAVDSGTRGNLKHQCPRDPHVPTQYDMDTVTHLALNNEVQYNRIPNVDLGQFEMVGQHLAVEYQVVKEAVPDFVLDKGD